MSLLKINLVVVGHKDHGKSTLIGRLLYDSNAIPEQKLQEIKDELKAGGKQFEFAFILDSLEEERTGGLTIDIMQTPFKSKKYFYTIIDCPGHREFIQKMLTGASQADAAILVVSAKEGIEDQTKQHLFLVKTLGVKQLIVAVNKLDIIGYDKKTFETFSDKIRAILSSLDYSNVPIVPVSAFEGENVTKPSERMKWYKGKTLIESLDSTVKPPRPLSKKPLRCVVQDIYEIKGRKIAVCRIETGTLKTGQPVTIMPINETGTVDKIEAFGSVVKKAAPGDSVGILLHGARQLKRGYILTDTKEKLKPVKTFVAQLIVFADTKLSVGNKVSLRIGTAEANCKIDTILEKIDPVELTVEETKPKSIGNGEVGKVLFRPLEPLYLEEYSEFPQLGRFVIIGKKGAAAAGIVLKKVSIGDKLIG